MIKKIIMSILLLSLIIVGGYFTYKFYKDDIVLAYNQHRIDTITRNITLHLYTTLSTNTEDTLVYDINEGSLENITEEDLALFYNEGETRYSMEKYNSTLIIKSALIEGRVYDGTDAHTMNKGFWHFPLSKAPGMLGNTIILGHRYDKMPPAKDTFFNLDKVNLGDKIIVKQDDQEWTYTVLESKVVSPDDRTVLAQTNDYRITLITCHPLWSSKQRLVVVAKIDRVGVI
jgi:LPXTG-site transpeptidase (sortase) family protein